jgi:hypothetical protein
MVWEEEVSRDEMDYLFYTCFYLLYRPYVSG